MFKCLNLTDVCRRTAAKGLKLSFRNNSYIFFITLCILYMIFFVFEVKESALFPSFIKVFFSFIKSQRMFYYSSVGARRFRSSLRRLGSPDRRRLLHLRACSEWRNVFDITTFYGETVNKTSELTTSTWIRQSQLVQLLQLLGGNIRQQGEERASRLHGGPQTTRWNFRETRGVIWLRPLQQGLQFLLQLVHVFICEQPERSVKGATCDVWHAAPQLQGAAHRRSWCRHVCSYSRC